MPGGLPLIKSKAFIQKKLGDRASDYRQYYYFDKLNLELPRSFLKILPHFFIENDAILEDVCRNYYEGLYWVMLYYYRGVRSWTWFYRYHYAPLPSDLARCDMFGFGSAFTAGNSRPSRSARP